ncbi:MAG TPA: hypothetical protein VGN12_19930 [Pirellulales bacterium]
MFAVVAIVAAALVGYRVFEPLLVEINSTAFGDQPDVATTVAETARLENVSLIRITIGQSDDRFVATLMTALANIANARGVERFIILRQSDNTDGSRSVIVGFTNAKDADLKQEFGDRYDYVDEWGNPREYIDASDARTLSAKLLQGTADEGRRETP